MLRRFSSLLVLALLLCLAACATPPQHTSTATPSVSIKAGRSIAVLQGETLYSYARRNNAPMREIIDLNGLQAPYILTAGQVLKLPASDTDLPSVELGPVAKKNESDYKQKHRGKPVTTYTQIAPEAINEDAVTPQLKLQQPDLQAEANAQFARSAPPHQYASATAALNLKPLEFDEARKHLVENIKPAPAPVPEKTAAKAATLNKQLADKNSKAVKTGKPDPNNADYPVTKAAAPVSPLPAEIKKPAPKVEVKAEPQPVTVIDPKKPELHSRIEKAAEPKNLIWPVQGTVISTYGPKSNGLKNDGINIAAPRSTPVLAADGGTVAYAGSDIPGYGQVVLVRHPNGLMTTYAHLERMFVQENIVVAKGDLLGTVGSTGGVDTPQLHFEIRHAKEALDPSKYLYR